MNDIQNLIAAEKDAKAAAKVAAKRRQEAWTAYEPTWLKACSVAMKDLGVSYSSHPGDERIAGVAAWAQANPGESATILVAWTQAWAQFKPFQEAADAAQHAADTATHTRRLAQATAHLDNAVAAVAGEKSTQVVRLPDGRIAIVRQDGRPERYSVAICIRESESDGWGILAASADLRTANRNSDLARWKKYRPGLQVQFLDLIAVPHIR